MLLVPTLVTCHLMPRHEACSVRGRIWTALYHRTVRLQGVRVAAGRHPSTSSTMGGCVSGQNKREILLVGELNAHGTTCGTQHLSRGTPVQAQ